MVDTFRPLELGEGGTRRRRREVRLVLVGPRTAPHDAGWTSAATPGFGLDNLPLRRLLHGRQRPRGPASAIGDSVLDLARPLTGDDATRDGLAQRLPGARARRPGSTCACALQRLADRRGATAARVEPYLVPLDEVTLHLPFEVADYVDFYSSRAPRGERRPDLPPGRRPLTPNWKHLPIGYHGRAGTVAVSGTPGRPPVRPAQGAGRRRRRSGRPAAGLRGRGRLRRRDAVAARHAGAGRRLRRARVRRLPGQRLVGPRPAGLGVRAARPVPRQVVPDLGLAVGGAARRAGGGPGRAAAARPAAAALPRRRRRSPGGSTSRWRCGSTATLSAARRSPACTGRRRSSSRT